MLWFAFILNAAMCAVNVAVYAYNGSPWSLGAAALSGIVAFGCLAVEVTR